MLHGSELPSPRSHRIHVHYQMANRKVVAFTFGLMLVAVFAVMVWKPWVTGSAEIARHQPTPTLEARTRTLAESARPAARLDQITAFAGPNVYYRVSRFDVPAGGLELASGLPLEQAKQIRWVFIVVTGEQPSTVAGVLSSREAFPQANVYRVNAQGITFTPEARLVVGGSFCAATAESLEFGDGTVLTSHSPNGSAGEPVAARVAIRGEHTITTQGVLEVAAGASLHLIANRVEQRGTLRAPGGGSVGVAALAGNERVSLQSPVLAVEGEMTPRPPHGGLTGTAELAGTIDVSASEAGRVGGTVRILSPLTDGLGSIDADGFLRGGQVEVNGHKLVWAGTIRADASDGDGGNNRIEGSLTPTTPGSYVLVGAPLGGPGSAPGQFTNPGKIR